MSGDDGAPELRIGDRERRETDDRLRAALDEGRLTLVEYDERAGACYEARFRRELDVLVADLPGADASPPPSPAPATRPDTGPAPAPRDSSPGLLSRIGFGGLAAAVVIGVGAWVAPSVFAADQGAAVFGSRTVAVAPGQDSIQVGVLFGSTRVVVPDGSTVTTDGTLIFGSTECAAACTPGAPGAVPVTVSRSGAFGSVDVVTATENARGEQPDGDDDDGDDDD